MELQSLRTFQAVVEEGGILSASRRLNTVQSNVTARIKRLEAEVGASLFYRKGRGLELAPTGRVLLEYAHKILQLETQAGMAVRQVGEQTGELRIGSMETFTALHLPQALKRVRVTYPGLNLRVETNTSSDLIDRVLMHKLDCAFVAGPVDHPDLATHELRQDELVLVKAKQVCIESSPLILFRQGCAYRARALAWRRESGYQEGEIMELGTLDGILGCVAVGLGCTLLPRWVVDNSRYRHELASESIAPHLAFVPTVMVWHRNTLPLKALDTLRGCMLSEE
ncbi:MAG: LysR family transcriptional regulator [Candidatus Thiodiazotropha sp. (ex Ctena orbiculata)]|uniref:LysR family transcriptional regulator n=1 Tax=Candidatus Thiodiazotropha taylori TaxID=2792791 RepID=A0A944MAH1_9GAMM|nr:LysR family transcriptional regulator [Candidatus Thiodiazotropha taylori]PUB89198.1 MAG: transcriptional regulator [gamma proteobacterium symbiont of Ctena orbiculata]MBT2988328.1 LysR family transcriptional regulator [Candidatus Thiodiazotropha taylori]MBT2998787.1 LysR family transcriptional regulator [Candidatus Thiodiazotropha taylori]MBT2999551.1 LysR family transcriptional regulator [Candidatus Thiodiazotropha taylori]